jgi:hypothetical protein
MSGAFTDGKANTTKTGNRFARIRPCRFVCVDLPGAPGRLAGLRAELIDAAHQWSR